MSKHIKKLYKINNEKYRKRQYAPIKKIKMFKNSLNCQYTNNADSNILKNGLSARE